MSHPAAVYHPRNPQLSAYCRCVEDCFETFFRIYDDHFERLYGFWRPYLEKVICRYLECSDLHNGYARVKCKDCGHEYLLAFALEQSGNPANGRTNAAIPIFMGTSFCPSCGCILEKSRWGPIRWD